MSVILILLTASLTIAIGFLIAFIWSVKNGQYDDDYTPSVRMLFEDSKPTATSGDAAQGGEQGIVSGNDKQLPLPVLRARDAKGLATASAACLLRHEEAGANAEPEAARPGAQKKPT